jgi:VanZ family protein
MKKLESIRLFGIATGCFGGGLMAVLSLLPAASVPDFVVGSAYDHLLAYTAIGFCFGSSFPSLRLQLFSGFALMLGALVFELLQNFIPGRSPDISDFMASSLGAWCGLTMALLAQAMCKVITK